MFYTVKLLQSLTVYLHVINARKYIIGVINRREYGGISLKQDEAESAGAESAHKGVNQRSKDVIQRQRSESPTVILTWHASKYKAHKHYRECIVYDR